MAKFTKEMREKYTVLIPSMLDFHMQLFKGIFTQVGFKAEIMTNEGEGVVNEGLKYVHNDICYPALLVIDQCIDNLKNRENTDKSIFVFENTEEFKQALTQIIDEMVAKKTEQLIEEAD